MPLSVVRLDKFDDLRTMSVLPSWDNDRLRAVVDDNGSHVEQLSFSLSGRVTSPRLSSDSRPESTL